MIVMYRENAIFDEDIKSQDQCFDFLVDQAFKTGLISDNNSIKDELVKREEIMSTALLPPFAIPHAKSSNVLETSLIFLRLKEEINWDESMVKVVIALFSKDGDVHISLLSNLSRKLVDAEFRDFCLNASEDEVFEKIQELGE